MAAPQSIPDLSTEIALAIVRKADARTIPALLAWLDREAERVRS